MDAGPEMAAAALVLMRVCVLVLRTGQVGVSLIFLTLAAVLPTAAVAADERWR